MPALTALLGTKFPIIQAPMAGSQDAALCIAVCEAGGLGSIPAAMLSPDALDKELARIRAATQAPYNVNFFCHVSPAPDPAREAAWRARLAPYYAEFGIDPASTVAAPARAPFSAAMAEVLERHRPPVVSFHFGLPEPDLLARVKALGALVLSSATTVEEGLWLQAHGADVVIAQGLEAGGHRGHFLDMDLTRQSGTFALLPQLVERLSLPVVAAGGIKDAKGVRAALALGAAGVQPGSVYLLAHEATTPAVHRRALLERPEHTALTNLFSGRPARGIVNRLMRELGPLSDVVPDFPLAAGALAPLRPMGEGDFAPLWAGQNVAGCREASAAEITAELQGGC